MPRKRRSSTGRRSIRWRATSSISSPSRRRCSEVSWPGCSISTTSWAARALRLLMSGLAVIVATGDLLHLRRQRVLRTVWAAALAAPALVAIATTIFLPWTGTAEVPTSLPAKAIAHFFGDNFERRTNQRLRAVAGDPQLASFIAMSRRAPASVARRHAGTNAVAVGREIQRDRRRRGLARLRHLRHATARDRAAVSRPGAGSAARLRMDGERPPAAVARRLGHRAAEGAVARFLRL